MTNITHKLIQIIGYLKQNMSMKIEVIAYKLTNKSKYRSNIVINKYCIYE